MFEKQRNNSGFTAFDASVEYEDDNAEALVYLVSPSGQLRNTALYVMRRVDAVTFCSRGETAKTTGPMQWCYCFTTHRQNWRNELDTFRRDDGRFDDLLKALGIVPIYRGGGIAPDFHRPAPPHTEGVKGAEFEQLKMAI